MNASIYSWAEGTPKKMREFWSDRRHEHLVEEGPFRLSFAVSMQFTSDDCVAKYCGCSIAFVRRSKCTTSTFLFLPASPEQVDCWLQEGTRLLVIYTSQEQLYRSFYAAWRRSPRVLTEGTHLFHHLRKAEVLEE